MNPRATARALPSVARIWGHVVRSNGAVMEIAGLAGLARIGDGVSVRTADNTVAAEVVATDAARVTAMIMGPAAGLGAGARAYLEQRPLLRPCDGWLGHIVDADGRSFDGREIAQGPVAAPLHRRPPRASDRRGLGPRIGTGLAALDTLLPLCRGQRLGVFAGSGVGKSTLLAALTLGIEADVVVLGLIGERGREVGEFVRDVLGPEGMARTVVVAATSDQPALVRRRAALTTLSVAEHFRDRGLQVLCLVDSLTRFAEAHREVALAAGEAPALRAFPVSTGSEVAALCERTGPGGPGQGDITAVFSVLVSGSDMDEPVADMVRGLLDGHVILDRSIAERGRFPAIDVRRSVSRSAPAAWSAEEADLAIEARRLISAYEDAAPLIRAGLYERGTDPVLDAAVARWPDLDSFVAATSRNASEGMAFARLAEILGRPAPGKDRKSQSGD